MSLLGKIGLGIGGDKVASSIKGMLNPQEQDQTVTTINAPWAEQRPYLTYGFEQAKNLYGSNASLNPALSGYTTDALAMQRDRALAGSPLNRMAQGSLSDTINGNYLYGGAGFNAALDAASRRILPQIDSTFANAGRSGSGLAATAQTQALADAFASQYGQERQNQMQAIGMAPQLAAQDYADIGALRDVGEVYDTQNQKVAMEPWQKLQMYQNSISGNYGGTSTTQGPPTYTNPLAGLLGGAAAGYSMGGPWGAAAGAGLGLLGSRR